MPVYNFTVDLTVGLAALFVGWVRLSTGICDIISSRGRNLQAWYDLFSGILLIGGGRFICMQSGLFM